MKKNAMTVLIMLVSASIADIVNASVPISVPEGDTGSLTILGLGFALLAVSILRRNLQRNT